MHDGKEARNKTGVWPMFTEGARTESMIYDGNGSKEPDIKGKTTEANGGVFSNG